MIFLSWDSGSISKTTCPYPITPQAVLSVLFEVGVSLLLAPAGADKRGPKTPFPLVEMQEYNRRFPREYPPELRREPGLTESTAQDLC